MNIIFIHGMNQQNYTAQSHRKRWLYILKQGLKQNQLTFDADHVKVHFPFYGDLLTQSHLTNSVDLETFLPKSFQHLHFPLHLYKNPPPLQEHHASSVHAQLIETKAGVRLPSRLYEESFQIKDKVLKELIILLDHFPGLHEHLIHEFLVETYYYLANAKFMHDVHLRILKTIPKTEKLMIVGHSLGSVIAYNLLQEFKHEIECVRFITLGSPLAFRIIQERVWHPISHPESLNGEWYNFYSSNDFLTAFPLTRSPFDFIPPILNQEISTSSHHPHEITGYLQHPDVLKSMLEIL